MYNLQQRRRNIIIHFGTKKEHFGAVIRFVYRYDPHIYCKKKKEREADWL
jgi:hypothetical protein